MTVDPCRRRPPSNVFRWRSTGAYYGQALMHRPEDEASYGRVNSIPACGCGPNQLTPEFDAETLQVIEQPGAILRS